MTSDAAGRFTAELAVLRDSVVRSIRQDNIADLKDGLELYASLVNTVLEQFRRYHDLVGPAGPGLFSFYGREMSWLEDDIRTFVMNAVEDPRSDAAHETLGFVLRLTREAFARRELPAFGSFLHQFSLAWHEGRRTLELDAWPRLRDNLLLTLENFGDYWIGRDLTRIEPMMDDPTPYAQRLIAEITQLMKASVDDGADDDLRAAHRTLHETMRHSIEELERTHDPEWPAEVPEHPLSSIKAAAVLSIEAWIRFRHTNGKTSEVDAVRLATALRATPPQPSWNGYIAGLDRATADLLRWTWWETSLWENRRGGVLSFDGFLSQAFAHALLDGRVTIPPTVEDATLGSRYRLQQLRDTVAELADAPSDPLAAAERDSERKATVSGRLEDLIQQVQLTEDQALVALPLLDEKVEAFRSAVMRAWSSPRHLRQLGAISTWGPDVGSSGEPEGFGINRLVPKDYFVEQAGVHADPEDLGRELGDGIGRGEDEMILAELLAHLPRRPCSLEALPDEVERAAAELASLGREPAVLIVNSWDLLSALRERIEPAGSWATADLEDAPRLRGTETPVLLRYAAGGAVCIVADFKQAFGVSYKAAAPNTPSDRVGGDGRILTSVSLVDAERASELIRSSDSFRRIGDIELDDAAALLNVQKSVHVRVLEWIQVTAGEREAGVVLEVEGAR